MALAPLSFIAAPTTTSRRRRHPFLLLHSSTKKTLMRDWDTRRPRCLNHWDGIVVMDQPFPCRFQRLAKILSAKQYTQGVHSSTHSSGASLEWWETLFRPPKWRPFFLTWMISALFLDQNHKILSHMRPQEQNRASWHLNFRQTRSKIHAPEAVVHVGTRLRFKISMGCGRKLSIPSTYSKPFSSFFLLVRRRWC